jgi:beta-xylosidase
MVLRDAPDGFHGFVDQVLAERQQLGAGKLPVYLTEWNNTPSQEDLLNDTCFKSCYIVKNILENYDRLDCFSYWSLTDWMGEAPLPRELFFGGLGLFTVPGIPKASYYALTLLRQLGDTFVGKGEGWFATRQGTSYRILLYNYRHFSHLYALGERFDMTFTDRYTPFDPVQQLDVHIALESVPNGTYTVRETVLNRKSGSAFDQWLEMGALEPDSQQELAVLEAHSIPKCSKYLAEAKNHTLELDAMLDMLEVRLLVIEP